MNEIINRLESLEGRNMILFLNKLDREVVNYINTVEFIRKIMLGITMFLIVNILVLILERGSTLWLITLAIATIICMFPIYIYSDKYNKLSILHTQINIYIKNLKNHVDQEENIYMDMLSVIIYLSKRFIVNKYRLITYIMNNNTSDLIKTLKIAI